MRRETLTRGFIIGVGASGFAWINFVAMRAVHFYADVAYPVERIIASDAFQTLASILWTLIALVLMGVGARRTLRSSWIVGKSSAKRA